jgi:uncharacterized protein (TIGR03435 family)
MTRTVVRGSLILLAASASSAAFAQGSANAPATLKFEVATVKHAVGGGPPGDIPRNMDNSPGHFAMRNVPLRYAIEWAYNLKDYEISGPDWIKGPDERYEIVGRASGPASEEEMRVMLQALLTERLQMKMHRETRELPVYVLLPGKGAPKVKEPGADGDAGLSGGATGVLFHKQPISRLTFLLTRRMGRPVLDMTGLTGVYDFTLDISGLNNFSGPPPPDDSPVPSIFTAIQSDLGLKLEARKHPIEILVIDSLNKLPIEN